MIDITEARRYCNAYRESHIKGLLSEALDELEAARRQITDFNIFAEEKENSIIIYYNAGKTIKRSAIIPQEGDAEALNDAIEAVGDYWVPGEEERIKTVLARYLSTIEGKA